MKATSKQYKKAEKIYEKGGASEVYDYAEEIGIDEWSTCFACETDTPDCKDDTCLVCGSAKEKSSPSCVSIRLMKEEDIEEVLKIGSKGYSFNFYENDESFLTKLRGYPKGCYVVTIQEKVVAYAVTFPYFKHEVFPLNTIYTPFHSPTCHYFHDVCVYPAHRMKGYAKLLINRVWNISELPKCLVAVNDSENFWKGSNFEVTRKVIYGKNKGKVSYMIHQSAL
jgi:hypothetical protein